MSTLKIPFGRSQGQLITECAIGDLEWMLGKIEARLCKGEDYPYAESDKRWADEAAKVLRARRSAGDTAAHPGAAPLAVAPAVPPAQLLARVTLGAIRDAEAASRTLAEAATLGHLITPQTAVGTIPEGCSLQVSGVIVDPERETYPQAGSKERGLHKVALNKIAAAAGIDWDPVLSRRIDNGSHPHYRCCQAVGRVRQFDGTWRTQDAMKEIDLRENGQDYIDIIEREAEKKRTEGTAYKGDGGVREVAVKRKHILSLCDTEAHLRVTRALVSLRVSYTSAELQKPFIVVRLAFDGRSENPETRAYFNARIADSFLGASQQLYGAPASAPQLRQAEPRIIELPADDDWGPPDYGFPDPPKKTGTGGPY